MQDNVRYNISTVDGETRITTAQRPGGTRKPRLRNASVTSDCICYDRDGNVTRIIARTASNRKPNRRRNAIPTIVSETRNDISLMAAMGSIHEGAA